METQEKLREINPNFVRILQDHRKDVWRILDLIRYVYDCATRDPEESLKQYGLNEKLSIISLANYANVCRIQDPRGAEVLKTALVHRKDFDCPQIFGMIDNQGPAFQRYNIEMCDETFLKALGYEAGIHDLSKLDSVNEPNPEYIGERELFEILPDPMYNGEIDKRDYDFQTRFAILEAKRRHAENVRNRHHLKPEAKGGTLVQGVVYFADSASYGNISKSIKNYCPLIKLSDKFVGLLNNTHEHIIDFVRKKRLERAYDDIFPALVQK